MTIAHLPYDAAAGAEIDDTFDTAVTESSGGISGRSSVRHALIRQFHLTIGPDDAEEVRAIHSTHRRRWPVGVRDWGRYRFEDEELAYVDDAGTTLAPLRLKIMPATGDRYLYQRILLPDEGEEDIVVSINGTPVSRGSWTFTDNGTINISSGTVGSGTLTASGTYLVPACFMDDVLTTKVLLDGLLSIPDVRLREVLEPELISLLAQTDDST